MQFRWGGAFRPFFVISMDEGVRLVSSAVLGIDCETIMVGGEVYSLFPPTIRRIAGAGLHLASIPENGMVGEMINKIEDATKALSWFIKGDESLYEALSEGTAREIIDGLEVAIRLIGMENFPKLSALSKSVRTLIASTRR